MRILSITGSYLPSRRASSIQVMQMAAAFVRRGHDLVVLGKASARRQEPGVEDLFAFYGVPAGFEIRSLPRPAVRGGGLLYRLGLARLLRRDGALFDLLYVRDPMAASLAARRELPFVFEAHGPPHGPAATRRMASFLASPACRRLVSISEALRRHLVDLDLVPRGLSAIVAHDAAGECRSTATAELPGRPPHVGYVGHLYAGKGAGLVAALARAIPDATFHLVGGAEADLARWRARTLPSNLVLHGFVPPADLDGYRTAFDVILLPYGRRVAGASGRSDLSHFMSPLKMFEAMAAGRAIVASDLPVLREILTPEETALLAAPDDPPQWERAVRRLLDDPALRRRLGEGARARQRERHTWDRRAEVVLRGLA